MIIAQVVENHEYNGQDRVLAEQSDELVQHARVNHPLPICICVCTGISSQTEDLQEERRPQRLLCCKQGEEEVEDAGFAERLPPWFWWCLSTTGLITRV